MKKAILVTVFLMMVCMVSAQVYYPGNTLADHIDNASDSDINTYETNGANVDNVYEFLRQNTSTIQTSKLIMEVIVQVPGDWNSIDKIRYNLTIPDSCLYAQPIFVDMRTYGGRNISGIGFECFNGNLWIEIQPGFYTYRLYEVNFYAMQVAPTPTQQNIQQQAKELCSKNYKYCQWELIGKNKQGSNVYVFKVGNQTSSKKTFYMPKTTKCESNEYNYMKYILTSKASMKLRQNTLTYFVFEPKYNIVRWYKQPLDYTTNQQILSC